MFAMEDVIPDVGGVAIMGWRQQRDGRNRDKMATSKDYFKYETQLILQKTLRVAICFWIKIKN